MSTSQKFTQSLNELYKGAFQLGFKKGFARGWTWGVFAGSSGVVLFGFVIRWLTA